MDQHYVPACYLAGFTDPDVPPRQTPFVWVRSRGSESWRRRAPVNVANEPEFYSFEDSTGERRRDVEDLWQIIETAVAPILRRLSAAPSTLSDEDRATLSLFAAAQFMRVPSAVENVKDFLGRAASLQLDMLGGWLRQDPARLAPFLRDLEAKTGMPAPAGMNIDAFDSSRYTVEVPTVRALQMMLPSLEKAADMISRMGWTMWVAEGADWFVTSDNPYMMLNPKVPPWGWGLGTKHIEVTLPLNSRVALLARWDTPQLEWRRADPELTGVINDRTAFNATELYAPKPDVSGWERLVEIIDSSDSDDGKTS